MYLHDEEGKSFNASKGRRVGGITYDNMIIIIMIIITFDSTVRYI